MSTTDIEDGLTPEEREALTINDDESPEAAAEASTQAAAETKDASAQADADKAAAQAAADEAAAAAAKAEEQAAAEAADKKPDAQAAPEAAPAPSPAPQQPAPVFVAEAVTDAEDKLKDISSKKETLSTQFEDGEITTKQYQAQLDALNKQEREIERAQDRAQLSAAMNEQAAKNAWYNQANNFARENGYTDNRRFNMLDAEVRAVATTEEGRAMDGAAILARAHQNLVEAGLMSGKAAAAPAPAPAPKPTGAKPEIPPSIHKLPSAGVDDAAGGQWAELDRLMTTDPIAYEQKLGSMKESERDRYLASA